MFKYYIVDKSVKGVLANLFKLLFIYLRIRILIRLNPKNMPGQKYYLCI